MIKKSSKKTLTVLDFKDRALFPLYRDMQERGETKFPLTCVPPLLSSTGKFSPSDYGKEKLIQLFKALPDYFLIIKGKDEKNSVISPPVYFGLIKEKGLNELKIRKSVPSKKIRKGITSYPKRKNKVPLLIVDERGACATPIPRSTLRPFNAENSVGETEILSKENVSNAKVPSLFRRYQGQPLKEIFAFFYWTSSKGENKNTWYKRIAEVAKKEKWSLSEDESDRFPLLHKYLLSSFSRAYTQDKILFSADGEHACFNTGLQTDEGKSVFLFFVKYRQSLNSDSPEWLLLNVIDSYSTLLRKFKSEPLAPTFIDDPSDLVFNNEYEFSVNTKHIIEENSERLPKILRDNPSFASLAVEGALKELKVAIQRDYRLPIPFFHRGQIQLLLPFKIEDDSSFVFVIERDDDMRVYRVKTILPTSVAYSNVRLLRMMDEDWLISSIGFGN